MEKEEFIEKAREKEIDEKDIQATLKLAEKAIRGGLPSYPYEWTLDVCPIERPKPYP